MTTPSKWVTALIAVICLSHSVWAQASFPSVTGTVFHDSDNNGLANPGEGMQGVTLDLFVDDGDGLFDAAVDTLMGSEQTDADGVYTFGSLGMENQYFVQQAEQVAGGVTIPGNVSALLTPSDFRRVIDAFADQQVTEANPIVPIGQLNLTSSSVIGGQRDLHIEYLTGPAEATFRANPYGLNEVLEFDQSAGVVSVATVTWDGIDADMSTTPALGGLGGIDLTEDGSDAFGFYLGVDAAGDGESMIVRVYTGSEVSTAAVDLTVTDGTASAFQRIPFDAFEGNASFSQVDAIQLQIGGLHPSVDAQIGAVGVTGPEVYDIAVAIPEPSALALGFLASGWFLDYQRRRRRRRNPWAA